MIGGRSQIDSGITDHPLDVAASIGAVSDPSVGAIGIFVGTVRSTPSTSARERSPVVRLEYEAHPTLADERLRSVAEEAAAKWNLQAVVAIHRTGTCELGEPTVVVACGSSHRAEALEACRWIIDTIKSTVPIWKKEVFADGSSWVDAESP